MSNKKFNMKGKSGVATLERIKAKCNSYSHVSQLHLPLCAIKSVLLKFDYDDNHPFLQYLENTELYFNENEGRGNYGIGINTAKELVYEIIDYIIIELQAFYENE